MTAVHSHLDGVSIITPCFNDGRFLDEAIGSVFAYKQTSTIPFEVVLVDDGSTDPGTIHTIAGLERRYSRDTFRVVRNRTNQGLAYARNVGLDHARFEYVFPLDSDNRLNTDPRYVVPGGSYFERGRRILSENPDVVLVNCAAEKFGAVSGRWKHPPYSERLLLSYGMIDAHAMYRLSDARVIEGYDTRSHILPDRRGLCEDWIFAVGLHDLYHRLGKTARLETISEPLFQYRKRGDGTNLLAQQEDSIITHRMSILRMMRLYPDIFKKHFPDLRGATLLRHVESIGFHQKCIKDAPVSEQLYWYGRRMDRNLRFFWRHGELEDVVATEMAGGRTRSSSPAFSPARHSFPGSGH